MKQQRIYAGSLRRRLLEYFEQNPGEYLTIKDIGVKFDAELKTVENVICKLRAQGAIKVQRTVHLAIGDEE